MNVGDESQLLKFPMQSSTRYDTSLQRRKETSPREEEKQNATHQKELIQEGAVVDGIDCPFAGLYIG